MSEDIMVPAPPTSEFQTLVRDFLSRSISLDKFSVQAEAKLIRMAKRLAPELPADLHEEIAQQLFLNLCGHPKFEKVSARPMALLFGLLRDATRQVRSDYCPPGRRKRDVAS